MTVITSTDVKESIDKVESDIGYLSAVEVDLYEIRQEIENRGLSVTQSNLQGVYQDLLKFIHSVVGRRDVLERHLKHLEMVHERCLKEEEDARV